MSSVMIKRFSLTFLLLFTITLFSQEKLIEFKNSLKTDQSFLNQMFSIVNETNGDISLFFIDSKNINGYLLNNKYELTDSIKIERRNKEYKMFLGYSISENNEYCIYLSNQNTSKFASICLSYESKKVIFNEFKLNLKGEEIIQVLNHKNKFYIITVNKKSSIINSYSFDNITSFKKKEIDFSSFTFRNENRTKKTLHKLLRNSSYGDVKIISKDTPHPIEITSAYHKLYVIDDKVIISFDENKAYTQLISFNLTSVEKEVKYIKKPFLSDTEFGSAKSNSYIYDDKVFLIAISHEMLTLSVKDYKTDELIKEHTVSEDDSVYFKNTALIKLQNNKTTNKIPKKNSDVLRKITNSKVGVSAYKFNNDYQITIGGKSYSDDSSIIVSGIFFGLSGAILSSVLNTAFKADVLYFKGVFDNSFNHLNKDVKPNVIEKISNFKTKNKIGINKGQTAFQYNDSFIYVNYNNKTKIVKLWKFDD